MFNCLRLALLLALACLSSCLSPQSQAYRDFYAHLSNHKGLQPTFQESDYFLVILVNARHLDYTDNNSFFNTVAKHPSDGSKTGDVGHAWVYLQGIINGEKVAIEGGHSGERGGIQAKYFDGIMNYQEWGYANPTPSQQCSPRYEPNPVKYLWTSQQDGFFQEGPGKHRPTYAAKINLTEEMFHQIYRFIQYYPYQEYAITGNQCSTFVAQIAALAHLDLDVAVSIHIQSKLWYNQTRIRLWEDPNYSEITFSSPDILEKSLIQAVKEGRAEYALPWYLKRGSH